MIQRHERNELLRKIEAYRNAWEAYVKSVAEGSATRYGLGAHVVNLGEELDRFVKEELS